MSLLPGQILPESVPFGRVDKRGQLLVDHNWYLFLYNLSLQVLSATNASGSSPASPYDLLDMADPDAEGADIPQAYRKIAGLQVAEIDAVDGADVAAMLRQLVNALLLASDPIPQDPLPPPGAVIPLAPATSPFAYTAIHDGTVCFSGTAATAITITRYGVTVPTGSTAGAVPVRKTDVITVTWSGSTAPTINFLPNR